MSHSVDAVAEFVVAADAGDLPDGAAMLLRRNVLDSLGGAIAALDGETVQLIREQVESVGGRPEASLIGGGRSTVDQAVLFNSVAVCYVDLLDTYLTPGGPMGSGGQLRCDAGGGRKGRSEWCPISCCAGRRYLVTNTRWTCML